MKRQLSIGVVAGLMAIVVLALLKREGASAQSGEGRGAAVGVVRGDELESFLAPQPPGLGEPTTVPAIAPNRAAEMSKVIATVELKAVPAETAIAYLRDLSGVNVYVNWQKLEGVGVDRKSPVTLSLRQVSVGKAFSLLVTQLSPESTRLGWRWDDNVLTITDEAELSRATVMRIYNVRDLLVDGMKFGKAFDMRAAEGLPPDNPDQAAFPPGAGPRAGSGVFGSPTSQGTVIRSEEAMVEGLHYFITGTVARESWIENGGQSGTVQYWAGRLIIVQTPEAHEKIEALLRMLRK